MDSQRKNELVLSQSDFELFALIKEGILGPCTHLMSKNETNEVLQKQSYKGEMTPYSFSFAPQNVDLSKAKAGDEFALVCEGEKVGKFRLNEKFQHKGDHVHGDTELFNRRDAMLQCFWITGRDLDERVHIIKILALPVHYVL